MGGQRDKLLAVIGLILFVSAGIGATPAIFDQTLGPDLFIYAMLAVGGFGLFIAGIMKGSDANSRYVSRPTPTPSPARSATPSPAPAPATQPTPKHSRVAQQAGPTDDKKEGERRQQERIAREYAAQLAAAQRGIQAIREQSPQEPVSAFDRIALPEDPELEQAYYDVAAKAAFFDLETGSNLDGVEDNTIHNWLELYPGTDLRAFIADYQRLKDLRDDRVSASASELPRSYWVWSCLGRACKWGNLMLVIGDATVGGLSDADRDELATFCGDNHIWLVRHIGFGDTFENVFTRQVSEVYVASEWPGMADDAATYGSIRLRTVRG